MYCKRITERSWLIVDTKRNRRGREEARLVKKPELGRSIPREKNRHRGKKDFLKLCRTGKKMPITEVESSTR